MPPDSKRRGFSLVELVMAVGVAAVTVIGVVALYRPIVRSVGALDEETRVQRLVERIEAGWRDRGFNAALATLSAGTTYFADREGRRIGPTDDPVWNDAGASEAERNAAKLFEFTLHRHPDLSPASEIAPGSIVIVVHIRWPAHRKDGARVTDQALQETRSAIFALSRR